MHTEVLVVVVVIVKVVDYIAVGQVAWCPFLCEHVGNIEQCPLIRGFAFLGFSYPQSIAV